MAANIVVSGMSGRFASSSNISELYDNLFIRKDRHLPNGNTMESGASDCDGRCSLLKNIDKFDCRFFGVHPDEVFQLDPQIRILLESTYESIVDAGIDPESLSGKNVGVFIGASCPHDDKISEGDFGQENTYVTSGWCKAILATYTSFVFNFKGPSHVIDSKSSSSALALYEAVRSMRSNECDAAVVGGSYLRRRPEIHDNKLLNETCESHNRAEAIVTLFLQKSDIAKRQYGSIIHVRNSKKLKDSACSSSEEKAKFLRETYEECNLNPSEISYIETQGSGNSEEMSAVLDVFCCQGRKRPLLVGCAKYDIGDTEYSSGLCSLVRVLLSMKAGHVPSNQYGPNRDNIANLSTDGVRFVTESTPWEGGYAAVNCTGSGGVDVHVVLKSVEDKGQHFRKIDKTIPRLVLYNGTTAEGVHNLFECLHFNQPIKDLYSLLHGSVYSSTQNKPFRGYSLLLENQPKKDVKKVTTNQRPLWYVFTGMGSQWPCMATDIMEFDVFEKAITRCAKVLKPHGIDLKELLTDEEAFTSNSKNLTSALVAISAVQVALIDLLDATGVKPDGLVGHSLGEIACAYAVGCITAEQAVLISYQIGETVPRFNTEPEAMYSIGMSWSEAHKSCPKNVFPACHNSENNVTIGGIKSDVIRFAEKLESDNIFVRKVNTCDLAFHCPIAHSRFEALRDKLKEVIPNPQPRPSKWISTSVPESRWGEPEAQVVDPSYFANNLVSPVLLHEALQHVPRNAILVEIAPHHLLQAVLKRTFDKEADLIALMTKNADNAIHLLTSLGKLYANGLNPDIEKLYPEVHFPVSKDTPFVSSLVQWDHTISWDVADSDQYESQVRMAFQIDLADENSPHRSLLDYSVNGKCFFPASGYFVLVWRTLADFQDKEISTFRVTFEKVKILRLVHLTTIERTKFFVCINKKGGDFEIFESGKVVCSGKVLSHSETPGSSFASYWVEDRLENMTSQTDEIYNELSLKNFQYGPAFRGITGRSDAGDCGLLKWNKEWVTFLDSILQFAILGANKKGLPNRIERLEIDPFFHDSSIRKIQFGDVPVIFNQKESLVKAGGVEMKGLSTSYLLYCQYLATLRT